MFISIAAAAAGAAQDNPYGLEAALREGGIISQSVFTILVGMSIFSFYILFTKLIEQQKIISQGKKVKQSFWAFGQPQGSQCQAGKEHCVQAARRRRSFRAGTAQQADRSGRGA
jgi:biopolymer transport protein ExbB/TolQ